MAKTVIKDAVVNGRLSDILVKGSAPTVKVKPK